MARKDEKIARRNLLHIFVEEKVRVLFCWLGKKAAKYPWWIIIGCLLFTLAMAPGMTMLEEDNAVENVWVPGDSRSKKDFETYDALFGSQARFSNYRAEVQDENENVLDKDKLLQLLQLQQLTFSVISPSGLTLDDVCYRQGPFSPCFTISLFDIWNGNATIIESKTQQEILDDITLAETGPKPKIADLRSIIGSLRRDGGGNVIGGSALSFSIFTKPGTGEEGDEERDNSADWEREMIQLLLDDNNSRGFKLAINAAISVGDEMSATIKGDLALIIGAFGVVAVYLIIVYFKRNTLYSHISLAGCSLSTVFMAILSAYGLGSYLGIKDTGPVRVFPFLILGVGIDASIIISHEFFRISRLLPLEVRLPIALANSGASVFMASGTDVLAFLITGSSPFKAVENFSWYAGLAVFFSMFYSVTFYTACLVVDYRRVSRHKLDCCCCFSASDSDLFVLPMEASSIDLVSDGKWTNIMEHSRTKPTLEPTTVEMKQVDIQPATQPAMTTLATPSPPQQPSPHTQPRKRINICDTVDCGQYEVEAKDEEGGAPFSTRVMVAYSHLAANTYFRMFVVVLSVMLLAVGIIGVTQLREEFTFVDLVGPNSYIVEWFVMGDKHYSSLPETVYFVMSADVVNDDPKELAKFLDIVKRVNSEQDFFDVRQTSSWINEYVSFISALPVTVDANGLPVDKADFYTHLKSFLFGPGGKHNANILFTDSSRTKIKSSRIEIGMWAFNDTHEAVDAMHEVRNIADDVSGGAIFPWDFQFLWYAQWDIIVDQAISNIVWSFVAVFFLMLLFLTPEVSATVAVVVAIISVDVIGIAHFWGMGMNILTLACVVMCIGFSVDYSAHITHQFLHGDGTGLERQKRSLISIGSSVLNGGTSTLLGIAMLSFSKSGIFIVFFKMIFLSIVLGLFMGLIALPAVLPWFVHKKTTRELDVKSNVLEQDKTKDVETGADVAK